MEWISVKDKWPNPGTEVVVLYLVKLNGMEYFESEVLHEKLIDHLDSSTVYWSNLPSLPKE